MLGYFTLLPVRFKASDDLSSPKVMGAMLFWLPLAGLVSAGGSVVVYMLLGKLGWPAAVVAALVYPMLYGFLHTEAVADVADALYAAHSGKDAYSIIKDPTIGAMGVLWTVAAVLLKTVLIVYLLMHGEWALFAAVTVSSRMGLEMLFFTQTFRSSFIQTLQQGFDGRLFWSSMTLFLLVGLAVAGEKFFLIAALAMGISYLVATHIGKALGFLNGDVLGTTLEATEIVLMLGGALLWL